VAGRPELLTETPREEVPSLPLLERAEQEPNPPPATPLPELVQTVASDGPVDAPVSTPARPVEMHPPTPVRPWRSWTDVLAGFMEERNIL